MRYVKYMKNKRDKDSTVLYCPLTEKQHAFLDGFINSCEESFLFDFIPTEFDSLTKPECCVCEYNEYGLCVCEDRMCASCIPTIKEEYLKMFRL